MSEQDGFLDHDPADENWNNASDELKSLLDEVEHGAKGWMPKAGDTVYGTVMEISEIESGDYDDYQMVTVKQPDGSLVNVHCFHTVLGNEISRKINNGKLKEGSQIAVKYLGEGEAKAGNNAPHMYRVAVRPPVAAPTNA